MDKEKEILEIAIHKRMVKLRGKKRVWRTLYQPNDCRPRSLLVSINATAGY